jgi:hypothetical protein
MFLRGNLEGKIRPKVVTNKLVTNELLDQLKD